MVRSTTVVSRRFAVSIQIRLIITPMAPTIIRTSPTTSQFTDAPPIDPVGSTANRRIAPAAMRTIESPNPMTLSPPFVSTTTKKPFPSDWNLNHAERYFWAFVAAIWIFLAGAGFAIIEGAAAIRRGETAVSPAVAYVVLAIAFVFEGTSLVRAVLQVRAGASRSRSSFAQFVRELRDPAPRVVFLEDSAAVVGIAIAALGIAARQITGDALWDGLAVGVLLAGVAIAVGSTQMIAFGILYSWPWLERFFSDDPEPHHLLQMPRDNPVRSAFGAALFTWVAVPLFAGSADRVFVTFSYSSQSRS